MEVNALKLAYFSPTGTTRRVLECIAEGMTIRDVECLNMTLTDQLEPPKQWHQHDLVMFGAPVYSGRLPVQVVDRFQQLKGDNTPVVLVVVYGNREFDDALLELHDLAVAQGFKPIAAAAFIGEHSFATEDIPIANGRPDEDDLAQALALGKRISVKLANPEFTLDSADVVIPGHVPYKARSESKGIGPVTKDNCLGCGICADLCPTGAITIQGEGLGHRHAVTDNDACIMCCACIKQCPTHARYWEGDTVKNIALRLNQNCSVRKAPQWFGL